MLGIANGTTGSSYQQGGSSGWNASQGWSSTLGTGAASSALSQMNAQKANEISQQNMKAVMEFNAREAQKQREWEEMMSNTAHQRAVSDLKAAGLNPILAAGAQASTPSGGMASTSALQAQMAREYTDNESRNSSEGKNSSWNYGESSYESNIAEQIKSAIGAIADAIGNIKSTGTSGKKMKEFVDETVDGVKGAVWHIDQNVKAAKQWVLNTFGKVD